MISFLVRRLAFLWIKFRYPSNNDNYDPKSKPMNQDRQDKLDQIWRLVFSRPCILAVLIVLIVVKDNDPWNNLQNLGGSLGDVNIKPSVLKPIERRKRLWLDPAEEEYCLTCHLPDPYAQEVCATWDQCDNGEGRTQVIIETFLEARTRGQSIDNIAQKLFKVQFPNDLPNRTHSYPFLTGDTLMSFADFVFDEAPPTMSQQETMMVVNSQGKMEPPFKIPDRDGKVIYLNSDLTIEFVNRVLPHIAHKFILITHNGNGKVPNYKQDYTLLEDMRLIRWFAVNAREAHHKLEAIPMGLPNQYLSEEQNRPNLDDYFLGLRDVAPFYDPYNPEVLADDEFGRPLRPHLILSAITGDKGPDSEEATNALKSIALAPGGKYSNTEFVAALTRSKFVLSPPGIIEDSNLTWEAILFKSIPVVRNSIGSLNPIFESAPVFQISSWTHPDWKVMLEGFKVKTQTRKTVMAQYWMDKIDSYRN